MNIKRPLSTLTLFLIKQNWIFLFYTFVISNNQGFLSEILRVVVLLGGKLNLLVQSDFDYDRALKQCLNVKSLIHGSETAMI